MAAIIEVPITNLPMSTWTRRDQDGRAELVKGSLDLFSEKLQLIPDPNEKVRKLVRSSSKRALTTVSATARINVDLLSEMSNIAGKNVELVDFVANLCLLLSFGSRRGVSFKPAPEWGVHSKPIVRGQCVSQGPVSDHEIAKLIENGLPKIYDPVHANAYRIPTALRWFTAWHTAQFVEGKMITLWIVLEMLAKNYWKQHPESTKSSNDFDKSFQYLKRLQLPQVSLLDKCLSVRASLADTPLWYMYTARNSIVHGDPETAEKEMCQWFGQFVEERVRKLEGFPGMSRFPGPDKYGSCLYEAIDMLSRVLEKVFLNILDCKDFMFYLTAPIHSTMMP
jgi:hypothetical protein